MARQVKMTEDVNIKTTTGRQRKVTMAAREEYLVNTATLSHIKIETIPIRGLMAKKTPSPVARLFHL